MMPGFLPWWRRIRVKSLYRVFLGVGWLSSMKCNNKKGDIMNEPIAASIARRVTAELATSALPDAPVRTEPTSRTRSVAPQLRTRSARLLVGLAGRLDPNTQTAN
jgi:hypothetical protein